MRGDAVPGHGEGRLARIWRARRFDGRRLSTRRQLVGESCCNERGPGACAGASLNSGSSDCSAQSFSVNAGVVVSQSAVGSPRAASLYDTFHDQAVPSLFAVTWNVALVVATFLLLAGPVPAVTAIVCVYWAVPPSAPHSRVVVEREH